MKTARYIRILLAMVVAISLTNCSLEEAPYTTSPETVVTAEILQLSAGFAQVKFTPSDDAYYLVDMVPVVEWAEPTSYAKQFMQLAIDSAYKKYISWRYDLLANGTPYVASFSSHALQYGIVDKYFMNLKPDTDYWLFCFTVDPKTMKPVGKLNIQTVRTKEHSDIYCRFKYRINGYWDYMYPVDSLGMVLSNFPYGLNTIDSLDLRDSCAKYGLNNPAEYFIQLMNRVLESEDEFSEWVYIGIQSFCNDGHAADGEDDLPDGFQEGHTYYTAAAGLDGGLTSKQNAVFRFTWHQDIDTLFEPHQTLDYNW